MEQKICDSLLLHFKRTYCSLLVVFGSLTRRYRIEVSYFYEKRRLAALWSRILLWAVLRIRDVYPGSRIRIYPSRISDLGSIRFRIPNLHQRISEFLTQKVVSKLSEIWSGMFIPDPGSWFFYPSRIPDPEVKKVRVPGFGSATLALSMKRTAPVKKKKGKTSLDIRT